MPAIRLLKTDSLPNSNDHYTNPFKAGEVVQYLGEVPRRQSQPASFQRQFIRIYRTRTKETLTESRKDFKILGNWKFDE